MNLQKHICFQKSSIDDSDFINYLYAESKNKSKSKSKSKTDSTTESKTISSQRETYPNGVI